MSDHGAANARGFRRRPKTVEPPLPDVHPDDAFADGDDHRWDLLEAEQRQDRLDDYADRPWPSATVVALPVGERDHRQAA